MRRRGTRSYRRVSRGETTRPVCQLHNVGHDCYIRLRGTNLGVNVANETSNGEPLSDALMGTNNAAKAYADLWFYSNPIFADVQ